jgi:4-hydroxybenzoate polyprenyltransferase
MPAERFERNDGSLSMKSMILLIWRTMRPHHWIKNLFVFAPLFFSGQFTDPRKIATAFLVFIAFSIISSSIYVFNDVADRESDRNHPSKCKRPIASGSLPVFTAIIVGSCFVVLTISVLILTVSLKVTIIFIFYFFFNIAYSFFLKNIVIVDVFCVSFGFVLRVLAGGLAVNVVPSSWLIIATFLLSLFLALGKRRHELVLLNNSSDNHRPVLYHYTPRLVDQLISVVTPVTLITYLLYTLDADTIARFNSKMLFSTGIFVIFGIFRYLYLIHRKDLGGSPTRLVLKDLPLLVAILGWILTFSLIVYFK